MTTQRSASRSGGRALAEDLARLGLAPGDLVMVHSSFRSLGIDDPEEIIGALLEVLGPDGTLMMPALTYLQEPRDVHDARSTPACVGFLSEYFRKRPGTRRSLHPTHSVCAVGARVEEMLGEHGLDTTPCGPGSPFRRNIQAGGKILMLGCGLRPNTTMHAVEEMAGAPYLLGPPRVYTITDFDGRTFRKEYIPHGFGPYAQRYDRVEGVMPPEELQRGRVGGAAAWLMSAADLSRRATARMAEDPYFFVERAPG